MKRIYTHLEHNTVFLITQRAHEMYLKHIGVKKLNQTYRIEEFATDADTEVEYSKRLKKELTK